MARSSGPLKGSSQWAVVSLGGSLIAPTTQLDRTYLTHVARCLVRLAQQGLHSIVVVGGGYPARWYQREAQALGVEDPAALDWIGIRATHLNATVLWALLGKEGARVASIVGKSRITLKDLREADILVAGGEKPGQSSDAVAVRLARLAGVTLVVNASNIPYVYDQDPATHPSARAFASLRWDTYLSLIPSTWQPGLSTPFDPTAAKEAQKAGIRVAILNGKNLRSLEAALRGMPFEGTLLGADATVPL